MDLIKDLELRYKKWCEQNITDQDLIINSDDLDKQASLELASLWLRAIIEN